MTAVQLPLPSDWPCNMSRRDPIAALANIERDKIETASAIKLLLDGLAMKHGFSHDTVKIVVGCYVDDMLDDVFLDLEEELARECDEPPRLS